MSATPIIVTKKDIKHGAWHYLKPALMILLSLPVLYVLSFGPILLVISKTGLNGKTNTFIIPILEFYSPIIQRAVTSKGIDAECLRHYLNLWLPADSEFEEP
jgi:hypothetical protein